MRSDVKVVLNLKKPNGSKGFGFPLILDDSSKSNEIAYAEYSDVQELIDKGYTTTDKAYLYAKRMFAQDRPPAYIAVCRTTKSAAEWLSVTDNINKNWRQMISCGTKTESEGFNTLADMFSDGGVCETAGKMLIVQSPTKDSEGKFKALSCTSDRIIVIYSDDTDGGLEQKKAAEFVGATSGYLPGMITYKNFIVNTTADELSDSTIKSINDSNGIAIIEKAGDTVTSEGKASSGEYIDIIDSMDYINQQLTYNIQKLLNTSLKIPYTNNGISQLESVTENVLLTAGRNNMINTDDNGAPIYSVSFALREETSEEDRAARKYAAGYFSYSLAGAIHDVTVNGEITV